MFVGGELNQILLLSRSFNLDGTKAEVALVRPKVSSPNKKKDAAPPTETVAATPSADELFDRALEEHRARTEEAKNRQLIATGEVLQLKDKPEREVGSKETQTLSEVEIWSGMELGCAKYLTWF